MYQGIKVFVHFLSVTEIPSKRPQSTGNKNKTKQMRLYQTKKLLHNIETINRVKEITCRVGESICKLCIQQGINIHDIQGTQTTSQQKLR